MKRSIFLIVCLSVQGLFSQSNLQNYLDELGKKGFSGSILLAQHGDILVQGGWGMSDVDGQIKNTSKTVYDIGSITKQFTAAGILKLEMQGKLKVEDPLSAFLPNLPQDKQEITLHELLSHSSGLPDVIGRDYANIEVSYFIQKAMEKPLSFEDETKYRYSNVGYSLLAMVIENVSGVDYETYLYQNLWKQAGMEMTGYQRPNFNKDEVAIGYNGNKVWGKPNEKPWGELGPFWHLKGNGGVLSTVEDMYKWHLALLNEDILSKEAKTKFFAKHIQEGKGSRSYYGYGWAIFPTSRDTELIAHNGGNGIFFADFWRFLEEDITLVFMTNKASQQAERIPNELARMALNPDYQPKVPRKF